MNIVVLTGAGISAESGIRTFRDSGGLWENERIENVATPEAFSANPNRVYDFYNTRRQQLFDPQLQPNQAHVALAEFARLSSVNMTLVTQNVDNLHERGGSDNVIHMHGELLSAKCVKSNEAVRWSDDLTALNTCQCCQLAQPMRPDIVWFGEMPLYMERIYQAIETASLFCAIGTSGSVYPAAGFVDIARQCDVETTLINLDETDNGHFDNRYLGQASECVPRWIESVKAKYELD